MFFYLLSNSTLIKEEDELQKNIKILVYGAIAYIALHATLFIGGEDCLFIGLKPYFWMLLLLDFSVLYLVYLQKNKGSIDTSSVTSVFRGKEREDIQPYLLDVSESSMEPQGQTHQQMPVQNPVKRKKKKKKNVTFELQSAAQGPPSPMGPMGSNSMDGNYSANFNSGFNPTQQPQQYQPSHQYQPPQQYQQQNMDQQNMLNLNIMPSSESDSDSDITTDIDLNEFERSISM